MPFTYRPETAGVSTLCRKIFFKFGNRQVYGLGNGLMACPFHATDLPGRESLKNMKPESPFLNLGQSAHCKKLLQGFPGILAVLYVNNSFFPFFIQSASGTMLRFLQTVDRNILAGLGALCPILLIVNLIGQGFQLCKVMFRFVRILLQIACRCRSAAMGALWAFASSYRPSRLANPRSAHRSGASIL